MKHSMALMTTGSAFLMMSKSTYAWGSMGHQIVGYIAQQFLDDQATAYVNAIIDPFQLSEVASWADQVKSLPDFSWSRTYHYADAGDNPPTSCGYQDERDCPNGKCLVGAITNYTQQLACASVRVQVHGRVSRTLKAAITQGKNETHHRHPHGHPDPDTPKPDHPKPDLPHAHPHPGHKEGDDDNNDTPEAVALKFLDHFFGDLTQPLHLCGRDRGGNSDKVRFGGSNSVNLHSLWDTYILEKRIRVEYGSHWETYADHLVSQIQSGVYMTDKKKWASTHSIYSLNAIGHSNAVIEWANDSDALDCSIVWPDYDADPTQDFAEDYYRKAVPVVDLQLAKGGYRLGLWLNQVFSSCPNKP